VQEIFTVSRATITNIATGRNLEAIHATFYVHMNLLLQVFTKNCAVAVAVVIVVVVAMVVVIVVVVVVVVVVAVAVYVHR
jgi:hypothetical protein